MSRHEYNPDFDIDVQYGRQLELYVDGALSMIRSGDAVEVKATRFDDCSVYFEVEQNPRGAGWRPSGLALTKASLWVTAYRDTGMLSVVPVEVAREFCRYQWERGVRKNTGGALGDNPTRGYWVRFDELVAWANRIQP